MTPAATPRRRRLTPWFLALALLRSAGAEGAESDLASALPPGDGAPIPDLVHCDGAGRIQAVSAKGQALGIAGELRVAGPGWAYQNAANAWTATNVAFRTEADGGQVWSGVIPFENGGWVSYEQRVVQAGQTASITVSAVSGRDLRTAGVAYFLQLPVRLFAKARVIFHRGATAAGTVEAPVAPRMEPDHRLLTVQAADRVQVQGDPFSLRLQLDRPRACSFQDDRRWNTDSYSLLVPLHAGPLLKAGETVRLRFELTLSGEPDRETVQVKVRDEPEGDPFEGFGGNFVYGLDSPVATALVERLAPVRARIEMALHEWEPENDNASADEIAWDRFEARDAPGTALRKRMELAAILAKRGVPLTISVWDLPEWMYEGEPKGRWAIQRTIAPDRWAEAVESACAYLLHLRKRYGVEPELFSFNEPEAGIRVLFTADQHRQAIVRFGEAFAKQGLKTRLLLADVSQPRGTESYGVYALSDPFSLRHIGAVGFHSWGGGTTMEYEAWRFLARRLGAPLDVTEAGLNPAAWRTPHELEQPYGVLQETRMILELLAWARPRSLLMWEYTDDYPLLKRAPGADPARLEETIRLGILEQLIRLTPRRAQGLGVLVSSREIPVVAYRGAAGKGPVVHLLNPGAERVAAVSGLPAAAARVTLDIRGASGAAESRRIDVKEGRAEFWMPPWALMTLHDCDARADVVQ